MCLVLGWGGGWGGIITNVVVVSKRMSNVMVAFMNNVAHHARAMCLVVRWGWGWGGIINYAVVVFKKNVKRYGCCDERRAHDVFGVGWGGGWDNHKLRSCFQEECLSL